MQNPFLLWIICLVISGITLTIACKSGNYANLDEQNISSFSPTTPNNHSTALQQPLVPKTYRFTWLAKYEAENMLINRIVPPAQYIRTQARKNSFADWLRNLPLKMGNPPVLLFNGSLKTNQEAHAAVFDIDVGSADLQQCADAVMRLRAEYLYNTDQSEKIHFNFTSGDNIPFSKWQKGYRVLINGNKVAWAKKAQPSNSYKSFKQYMNKIFTYAGTYSLSQELKAINITTIQAGDVFIKGGFPGHAVMVVDVATHPVTNDKAFLLAQSYMPAQNIQLLHNPNNAALSPWYSLADIDEVVHTPEWTFNVQSLKRFVD